MQIVSKVIAAKPALQILDSVLFELKDSQLILTASDGETTIRTTLGLDSAEGEGKVALQAKRLMETLKEFPEQPLTFDINNQNFGLNIYSANGEYSFVGINGEEYPEMIKQLEDVNSFVIDANVLVDALNKTVFCTGDDEIRPVMNGVFFDLTPENITLVATDAHRLVRYINTSAHTEAPANFILPKRPANTLRSMVPKNAGDMTITFNSKNVRFDVGDSILICRQIEGKFPNYNAVIPQNNNNKLIIDRQSILNAARRVSVFANQGTGLIKLALTENKLTISAQDIDFSTSGEETLECNYSGMPMNIGFKAPFLIELIAAIQSNEVVLEMSEPSRAGLILPFENQENEEVVMLLMPMLLND